MSENAIPELEGGKWIKAQVEAACGNKIHGAFLDVIPENVDFPAVRYEVYVRQDVRTVAQHIVWTRVVFRVYVTIMGEVINDRFLNAARLLHAGLHKQSGETDAARIVACTRLESFNMTEVLHSQTFRHAGGLYELLIQGLPETP